MIAGELFNILLHIINIFTIFVSLAISDERIGYPNGFLWDNLCCFGS
jgi:hypothetical protein